MATYAGHYDEILLRKAGSRLAPAAAETTVLVYESDGATVATLYTDRTKATEADNPLDIDDAGNLEFFAEPGTYVIAIREGGVQVATDTVAVPYDPVEGAEATVAAEAAEAAAVAAEASAASSAAVAEGVDARVTSLEGAIVLTERGNAATIYVDPSGDDAANGLTRSTAKQTVAAALSALGFNRGVVELPPGAGFDMGATSIDLDVSLHSIYSPGGATLSWSAAPTAGYGIHIFSTTDYIGTYENWRSALDGVILSGGTSASPFAGAGLRIGHAVNTENAVFRIANGGVQGFVTNVEFIANAWRVVLDSFHVRWGAIEAAAGLSNFGENMQWRNSMINDGAGMDLGTGEWHFDGCSFDNYPVTLSGDVAFYATNPHFENPGSSSTGYKFLSLGSGAEAILTKAHVVISDPAGSGGTTWQTPPFYVDPANTTRGLLIDGLRMIQADWQAFDLDGGVLLLVAGGGRAVVRNMTSSDNGNGFALAEASNAFRNGNAEDNNTTGWTTTEGTHTVNSDPLYVNRGTYSHKLTAAAGWFAGVYQEVPVTPGAWVCGQLWRKTVLGVGASASWQLQFFDNAGNQISSARYQTTAVDVEGVYPVSAIAPAGAASCRIHIDTSGGSTESAVYFDDVIVNLT